MMIKDKVSVFWGFGVDNRFSQQLTKSVINRQNQINQVDSYTIDSETKSRLLKVGILPINY